MSAVIAVPELITEAATDLATIGSNLSAAHAAAAPSTLAVIPAAADEVSVRIAHLFSQHARDYQALAGKAAASQHQFAHNLKASAAAYASAEAANTAVLQPLAATADSIGSALAGLWDQLVNMVNAAVGQLTGFLNALSNLLLVAIWFSFFVGAFVVLPLSLIVLALPFDLLVAILALFGIKLI